MPEISNLDNEQSHSGTVTVTPVTRSKPWSVWGGTPWNPTCGRISLERGAKAFLRIYMYLMIFYVTILLGLVVLIGIMVTFAPGDDDVIRFPKNNTDTNSTKTNTSEVIEDLEYYERSFAPGYFILIGIIAWQILTGYSCYKCRKALEQGIVEQMKKHFWIVFLFVFVDVIGSLVIRHGILFVFLVEIPMNTFSILGILFVYNYILERIQCANTTLEYRREDNPQPQPV